MKNYSIEQQLNSIYSSFPEAKQRPLIGITGNFENNKAMLHIPYYDQVVKAGGIPIIIPPVAYADVVINTLENIDGLLLSGGADINPLWVGEDPIQLLQDFNAMRDLPELLAIHIAYNRQIPMFGICRGCQMLALTLGGHIAQDLSVCRNNVETPLKHSQKGIMSEPSHMVDIVENSIIHNLYGTNTLAVNSLHHQAVDETGNRFRVTAIARDGVIEAIESTEHRAIMGVQWHPEWLADDGLPLFRWLVNEATLFAEAKKLHRKIITLDTHCDTPMLFPQGVDFSKRDNRALVDLHKMADGRQDAVIMAAYIPQDYEQSAYKYAENIFDKIEQTIAENHNSLAKATNKEELIANKAAGKHSIMLAIENGKALEGDIKQIEHFAERGIVYITLCHNGDNNICDSARGENTYGGLSDFGKDVVREMNRCGVMVDLSHAAESSFYDALQLSSKPIVCSHSSCKALCNHPRNLSDKQMRDLAAKGGVCQITLYPGFLREDGKATINDVVEHLEHAINIMGIDHVGIGTDYDGDGGVTGMSNASENIQLTMALLKRGYSATDIEKIWGGNWLRVMEEVKNTTPDKH